jgi:hypothetical protein
LSESRTQVEDKVEAVQTDAATANSIPALRIQVVKLAEALEEAVEEIKKLQRRSGGSL